MGVTYTEVKRPQGAWQGKCSEGFPRVAQEERTLWLPALKVKKVELPREDHSRRRVPGHLIAMGTKMWQQADPGLLSVRSK